MPDSLNLNTNGHTVPTPDQLGAEQPINTDPNIHDASFERPEYSEPMHGKHVDQGAQPISSQIQQAASSSWVNPGQGMYYPQSSQGIQTDPLANYLALRNWRTSVWLSVLGAILPLFAWALIVGLPISLFMQTVLGYPYQQALVFSSSFVIPLVESVAQIIYALVFYRSYFTEKPRMTSSKAISFWNFFFGSFIFGALWNSNLTRSARTRTLYRGSSYIVAVVLASITIAPLLVRFIIGAGVGALSASQQGATQEPTVRSFPTEGITVTIPTGWTRSDLSAQELSDEGFLFIYENSSAVMGLSELEAMTDAEFNAMTEEQVIETFSSGYDIDEISATKIELGGKVYWEVSAVGPAATDPNQIIRPITTFTAQNNEAYYFKLTIVPADNPNGPDDIQVYHDMIASAVYE